MQQAESEGRPCPTAEHYHTLTFAPPGGPAVTLLILHATVAEAPPEPFPPPPPAPLAGRVGRNDPCPCGSGRKFKRCCLAASLARVGDTRPKRR
jgi:uncharacterized protein YecA (UPF0149 family)